MTTHPTPTATPAAHDDLESRFGNPFDEHNPVGFAAVLDADERAVPLPAGELLLADWQCSHELVPRSLGGRWGGTDALVRRLRPVFRRDPALAVGHGVASLAGAVTVWAAGSPAQRSAVADALLDGKRITAAFHELAHGEDFLHNEFTARIADDRVVLAGGKQVVLGVEGADLLVLFARSGAEPGPDAHSTLLVAGPDLPPGSVRYLPRFATPGLRGCHLGGIVVDDAAVGHDALLGAPGRGMATVSRAFQVTRATLPGMAVGVLDTALHLTHDFAADRRLYGHTVTELPHARATLAGAFTDLLIADSLATAVSRHLHLAPHATSAPAAAVGHLVPLLLADALHDLSVVLGARSYLREGRHAAFSKLLRDLPLIGVVDLGPTSCLLTILPQLPSLARRRPAAAPPAALFDTAVELPELDVSRLSVTDTAPDLLLGALTGLSGADGPAGLLATDLAELRDRCRRLPETELGPTAGAPAVDLARRYALLLAAAACIGTHRVGGGFAGEPGWLAAALTRLAGRLGHGTGLLPDDLAEPLFDELTERVDRRLSADLQGAPIFR